MRLKFDYDNIKPEDISKTLNLLNETFGENCSLHIASINVYVTLKNEDDEIMYPVDSKKYGDIIWNVRNKPYKKSGQNPKIIESDTNQLYVYQK